LPSKENINKTMPLSNLQALTPPDVVEGEEARQQPVMADLLALMHSLQGGMQQLQAAQDDNKISNAALSVRIAGLEPSSTPPVVAEGEEAPPPGAPQRQPNFGAAVQQQLTALAPAPAAPLAPEVEPEEDDELEDLVDRLEGLDSAPVTDISKVFGGHNLPVEFRPRNPFLRGVHFQDRTLHYDPQVVGDFVGAQLCSKFESISNKPGLEGMQIYTFEARSLISGLSYMYDAREEAREVAALAVTARADGTLPAELAQLPARLLALAEQMQAMYQHGGERLAVLRKIAGGDTNDLAVFAKIYDREQERAGAECDLEVALNSHIQQAESRTLTSITGRERAKAAAAKYAPPKGQPPPIPRRPSARGARPGNAAQAPAAPREARAKGGGRAGGAAASPAPAPAPAFAPAPAAVGAGKGKGAGGKGAGKGMGAA
jgi:hypothetical protein